MSVKAGLSILVIILAIAGYAIIITKLGWTVALGVFMVHFAINIEQQLKRL